MAQLPKGGLVGRHGKPIHGSCAIYFPGGIFLCPVCIPIIHITFVISPADPGLQCRHIQLLQFLQQIQCHSPWVFQSKLTITGAIGYYQHRQCIISIYRYIYRLLKNTSNCNTFCIVWFSPKWFPFNDAENPSKAPPTTVLSPEAVASAFMKIKVYTSAEN